MSNFFTSLHSHACIHKVIHFEKSKLKHTTIFYLYHKEVRLIKNTWHEHSNTCKQRELLNLLLCSVEKFLHSSTIVAINLSCVKPSQFRRNSSCSCNVQKQLSIDVLEKSLKIHKKIPVLQSFFNRVAAQTPDACFPVNFTKY